VSYSCCCFVVVVVVVVVLLLFSVEEWDQRGKCESLEREIKKRQGKKG